MADFYFQIQSNFPHVARRAYKRDTTPFMGTGHTPNAIQSLVRGTNGYRLVDAGHGPRSTRQVIWHNRLRGGGASGQDLGIDWRWVKNTLPNT